MALEITAAAVSREAAIAFLQAVNIATVNENNEIVPIAEVIIHPFRPTETITIIKTPAVIDPDTLEVITPAEIVPSWHWNMRFYGTSEATLRKPEPEGGWTSEHDLFDRTFILELCAGRAKLPIGPGGIEWVASADDPVPPGYQTPDGVRAFDPNLISTRVNVFA